MNSDDNVNWKFYPNIQITRQGNETISISKHNTIFANTISPNIIFKKTISPNILSKIHNYEREDKILNQINRLPWRQSAAPLHR